MSANPFVSSPPTGRSHPPHHEDGRPSAGGGCASELQIVQAKADALSTEAFDPRALLWRGAQPDPSSLPHLTWMWVSAMIARQGGLRVGISDGLRIVRVMASLPRFDAAGTRQPALAALGAPTRPARALRALGVDVPELNAACRTAARDFGRCAVIRADIATAVVPLPYWPVLAHLLAAGPAATWELFERAMAEEAGRPLRRNDRRRADQSSARLSRRALEGLQNTFRMIMDALLDLRRRGIQSPWLARWPESLPSPLRVESLDPDPFRADRTAPDLLATRRAWQELEAAFRRKVSTKRGRATARRQARDRALIAVVLGTGMRIDAVGRLRPCDISFNYRFRATGEVGPAIRATPRKGRGDQPWKGVHAVVAECLRDYFDIAGLDSRSRGPLWPSDRKLDPATGDFAPMDVSSLSVRIGGKPGTTHAFVSLPIEPGSSNPNADRRLGYSPHSFRHLVSQYLFEAGSDFLDLSPGERRFITPQVITAAALDQQQTADVLGYLDLDDPVRKERLTRIGLVGLGEYLWGDRGARQAPDALRVAAADRLVAEVEAAVVDAQRRRVELRDAQRAVMNPSGGEVAAGGLEEAERQRRLFEAYKLSLAIEDVSDEIQRATERLGEARLEAERARSTLVPVDDFDDLPEPPPGVAITPAAPLRARRDRVTVAEAAAAFDVAVSTMRRWFLGKMPYPPGDLRNPWDPGPDGGSPECILQLGPRSRWLLIDKLDPSRVSPQVMEALRGVI